MSMRLSPGTSVIFLSIYLSYLLFFALAPFTFHPDAALSLIELIDLRFEGMSSLWRLSAWDIWTNVLLFFPFGLLVILLPSMASMRPLVQMLLVSAFAAFLSFGIEVAQALLPRQPSIADVVCNVLGAILGAVVGIGIRPAWKILFADGPPRLLTNRWSGLTMLVY